MQRGTKRSEGSAGRRGRRLAVAAGLALLFALAGLRLAEPVLLVAAREAVFDLFQQVQPRAAEDLPVVVVDIDEAALARYGQWPWPRSLLAELTERLADLGAAVVVYDVIFAEPDRYSTGRIAGMAALDHDARLAEALTAVPTVLGLAAGAGAARSVPRKAGIAISGDDPSAALPRLDGVAAPIPVLAAPAAGLGAVTLGRDDAGTIVRHVPLVWAADGGPIPALALEALRVASGETTLVLFGDTAGGGVLEAVRVGPWTVPVDSAGRLRLHYRPYRPEALLSVSDVLGEDSGALVGRLAGHIVLVGTSASGLSDIRRSALGEAVPGVTIHAQAIEQILAGTYLHRADWVAGLELAAFLSIGTLIVLGVTLAGPLTGLALALAAALVALAGSWLAYARLGVLFDPAFLVSGAIVLFAAMAFLRYALADAERRRIRHAFAHYVAPAVLGEIERNIDRLGLGGEERELTVMFADVRNFTALGQRLAPARLLSLLNRLFDLLGRCITASDGTIDKFLGDAIMAFWNAPLPLDQHPRRAAAAALDMRAAVAEFNRQQQSGPADPLAIGIGLATGPAIIGNVGARERFDYSCIGDTVNLASRLQDACKHVGYDIVVSEATRARLPDLATLPAGRVMLKGMAEPIAVHILVGNEKLAADPAFVALGEHHRTLLEELEKGEPGMAALAACRAAANSLESGLELFYGAIMARRDDFCAADAR